MNTAQMEKLLQGNVGHTYASLVREFMMACGQLDVDPHTLTQKEWEDLMDFRKRLIEEEVVKELLPAMDRFKFSQSLENATDVLDGICDAIYVLLGAALAFRLPVHAAFLEVQRSNMAKIGADGVVRRREDGKILKPEGWTPPDILGILLYYHPTLGDAMYKKGLRHRGSEDSTAA